MQRSSHIENAIYRIKNAIENRKSRCYNTSHRRAKRSPFEQMLTKAFEVVYRYYSKGVFDRNLVGANCVRPKAIILKSESLLQNKGYDERANEVRPYGVKKLLRLPKDRLMKQSSTGPPVATEVKKKYRKPAGYSGKTEAAF